MSGRISPVRSISSLEAIIFDMDGVLIDSEPLHIQTDAKILQRYGVEVDPESLRGFTGLDNSVFYSQMRKTHGIIAPVEELIRSKNSLFIEELRNGENLAVKGFSEVKSAIQDMFPLRALASSSFRNVVDTALTAIGLEDWFLATVAGDEVALAKPDPEVFVRAAENLKVSPANCIVVEDSTHGIEAAIAAGMCVVGYINPLSGNQDLSRANHQIASLIDLPGILQLYN